MHAFVQALNSNDNSQIEEFIKTSHHPQVLAQVPMSALVARWLTVHAQSGPVEPKVFKSLSANTAIVWTRGSVTQIWVGFQFFFEKQEPHRITMIARDSGPMAPPEFRLARATSPGSLARKMTLYLDAIQRGGYFSGSILIAHNGKPILRRGIGMANSSAAIPNRPDTIYNIASLSKMFASVAVAQLVEKGLVSYNDPLSKFIPEYPKHIADQVTIHNLLTHTSGIELDDIPEFNARLRAARSVKDFIDAQIEFFPKIEGFKDFKRPVDFNYSNEGYALLARIVEVASGDDYYAYLEKNILHRAKMTNTIYRHEPNVPTSSVATGYTNQDPKTGATQLGPMREVRILDVGFAAPSGGLHSTVDDLLRFSNGLIDAKFLSKQASSLLWQPHVREANGRSYGYGFSVVESEAGERIGHSGANMGFSSRFDHYPKSGYTVIVLSNRDRAATSIADLVAELLAS
jgi:D-alanyl-D-alanine carboxypeptidase